MNEGWNRISSINNELMEISPDANSTANNVRRENISLRVFKEVIWMTFDQYEVSLPGVPWNNL